MIALMLVMVSPIHDSSAAQLSAKDKDRLAVFVKGLGVPSVNDAVAHICNTLLLYKMKHNHTYLAQALATAKKMKLPYDQPMVVRGLRKTVLEQARSIVYVRVTSEDNPDSLGAGILDNFLYNFDEDNRYAFTKKTITIPYCDVSNVTASGEEKNRQRV